MADRDTIRRLIADPVQYDRAQALGDGTTDTFLLPNAPVVVGSVVATVNGAAAATSVIDYEAGLATMAAAPVAGSVVVITYRWTLLSDAALDELLVLEGASIKLAAAQALDIIGTSEVLIQKRIQILDLQTDGPAVAEALMKRATELRNEAAAGQGAVAADYDGAFAVAEHGWDPATRRDIRWRAWEAQDG